MRIRIISAVVALAILIPLIWLGGYPFAIGMGLLSILAYKEIIDLKKSHKPFPRIVQCLGLISLLYIVIGDYGSVSIDYSKIFLPIILLLIPTIFYKKDRYLTNDALFLLGSVYLIGFLFNILIILRSVNLSVLIYLLVVTILTDTFAYAIGCLIGKHKMAPKISPKKSWEGAIAGFIGGSIVGSIVYTNFVGTLNFKVVLVTIILSIVGQLGDLFYSKIKRENGIKDFSNIMPGHGGILDRVDSLTFVVFTYMLLLSFI